MTLPTIGFIGLGIMGKPMARNLAKAGYALVIHSRSLPPVDELAREGAKKAASPQEVASHSEVVITMLPDSPDVETVVAGEHGVFAGARSGSLLIDMSTISPIVARRLAKEAEARGLTMLDAPVSGGEAGAINAALSIMVGGSVAGFERALPIFQAMGKNIVYIGDAGAGQVTKAANQVVVGLTIAAVSEALTLARGIASIDDFLLLPITLLDPPGLHHQALTFAAAHSLGAHDAHYVALAYLFGCELWVDDRRMLRAVQGRLPFVKWIGDYASTSNA